MCGERCCTRGGTCREAATTQPRRVTQVVEKCDLEMAIKFLKSGIYFLNGGMFVFRAERLFNNKPQITIFAGFSPRVSKNFTLGVHRPRGCAERSSENQWVDVFGLNIARKIND